jgi:hypothetical protein
MWSAAATVTCTGQDQYLSYIESGETQAKVLILNLGPGNIKINGDRVITPNVPFLAAHTNGGVRINGPAKTKVKVQHSSS